MHQDQIKKKNYFRDTSTWIYTVSSQLTILPRFQWGGTVVYALVAVNAPIIVMVYYTCCCYFITIYSLKKIISKIKDCHTCWVEWLGWEKLFSNKTRAPMVSISYAAISGKFIFLTYTVYLNVNYFFLEFTSSWPKITSFVTFDPTMH